MPAFAGSVPIIPAELPYCRVAERSVMRTHAERLHNAMQQRLLMWSAGGSGVHVPSRFKVDSFQASHHSD